MTELIAHLRRRFPDAGPLDKAPYCPGGALALYLGVTDDPFPAPEELACHIEDARGEVERSENGNPRRHILRASERIARVNDAGDTAEAWRLLGSILRGTRVDPARTAGSSHDAVEPAPDEVEHAGIA